MTTFLDGLAGYRVVFTQLVPGTKRTTRTWDYFENLHDQHSQSRLDLVSDWLRKGYGVGYLLRNRLAAVDADDAATVQRVLDFEKQQHIFFPKVSTPGGGIHALFLHTSSIEMQRLKNHVCHPKVHGKAVPWDFKLGERTMLVAPGTVTPKGVYMPGGWSAPPVLDIRSLAPKLEIYRNVKDFIRDTRPLQDRVMASMTYLRTKAPISVEGRSGHRDLMKVALHLVGYHDLDPSLAFHLLTKGKTGMDRNGTPVTYTAWNDRCINGKGDPCPWTDDALMNALESAVDGAPAYGVHLLQEAKEKEFARWSAAAFIGMLTFLPEPTQPIWITADALYRVFLEFSGVKPGAFIKSELGLELALAISRGQLPFVLADRTHALGRIYRGLDQNTLRVAMDASEQRYKAFQDAS